MRTHGAHRWLLLLFLSLLAALAWLSRRCGAADPTDRERAIRPEVVVVHVDGCTVTGSAHGCTRPAVGLPTRCEGIRTDAPIGPDDPMSLVLWSEHRGQIAVGGTRVEASAQSVDGGWRWRIDVPTAADSVAMYCASSDDTPCWSMPIRPPPPEPRYITDARAVRALPKTAQHRARRGEVMEKLLATLPTNPGEERLVALDIVADLSLQRAGQQSDAHERDKELREALHWTAQAFGAAEAMDYHHRASCHARRALRYWLENLGEHAQAQVWNERLQLGATTPLAVSARNDYYRALLAQREGDLPAARSAYLRAERGAARLDDWPLQQASLIQGATVLSALGQEQGVEELFGTARRSGHEPLGCVAWLQVLNNHSWARYQLAQLGRPAGDPVPDLDEVLMLADTVGGDDPCHWAGLAEHARLNLGLVAAQEGWTGQAQLLLEHLEADHRASNRFWVELLRQQLVLARADHGELIEWVMRDEPLDPGALPERHWLRHFGRGRALQALHRPAEAIAAYRAAEDSLDAMMRSLNFDVARERLLRGRQPSAARLVALLAAHGDAPAALCAARRARRRTHEALDRPSLIGALNPTQRRRWTDALDEVERLRRERAVLDGRTWALASDDLPAHERERAQVQQRLDHATANARAVLFDGDAVDTNEEHCEGWRQPSEGETALLYFPIDPTERRWQGFAFTANGQVETTAIETPAVGHAPTQAWSDALLAPFAATIDQGDAVRLLPTGSLWTVPFAALPWRDDVLLEHATVSVSLDLAPRSTVATQAHRALVVGDPSGDLPAARQEASVVTAAIASPQWSVHTLRGAQATAPQLFARLPQTDLLHYAGHAHQRGTDGWGSALRLAADTELHVSDVLALPAVPSVVMLPACNTASTAPATMGGGMSIARAFLLAGSQLVVASQDELDDEFALALAASLYREGPIGAQDGPAQLRRALLATRGDSAAKRWWPVVALVP